MRNEEAVAHVAHEHEVRVRDQQRSRGLVVHTTEFHRVSTKATLDDRERDYRIENGYFVLNSSCSRFIKWFE